MSSWAHSVESFPLSRVLPLYHCSLACKSVGTLVCTYMLGVALGAMSPSGNTKVLSLLAIAQRLETRWPDSEGQGFDSQKSWSAKPLNGKQTWPTSCRPTTTTYVANHSGPLLLCTTEIISDEMLKWFIYIEDIRLQKCTMQCLTVCFIKRN